jgi:hypothetical protein
MRVRKPGRSTARRSSSHTVIVGLLALGAIQAAAGTATTLPEGVPWPPTFISKFGGPGLGAGEFFSIDGVAVTRS